MRSQEASKPFAEGITAKTKSGSPLETKDCRFRLRLARTEAKGIYEREVKMMLDNKNSQK